MKIRATGVSACRSLSNFDRRKRLSHLVLAALTLAGCARLDMQDQPKYKPQRPSEFFADGRANRPEVEGTVARGQLDEATVDVESDVFPIAVDKAFIVRGQERYDIYCAPCHGRIGNGLGMIVRRGFKQPPSYHIDRLRNAPAGHYYDVITNGYGAMLNYASQVQPRDRWAIIAYIRALQYSQNASVNDLPADMRAKAMSPEMTKAQQIQPLAPYDPDFHNFPHDPATPSGVPGAHGAGAYKSNQPERK